MVRTLAAQAARTVGRTLRARGAARLRGHDGAKPVAAPAAIPYMPLPQAPRDAGTDEGSAEAAELDALRGALVRELDRLAAGDDGSAGFRRA